MATINTDGRPAYMYDADTSTWYAISGRVSTNANYVWSGAHQYTNNVTMDGALTATLKFNSFLNPAARTTAIPSPGTGLLTFLQQDAVGTTINRFEYWNGSAWTPVTENLVSSVFTSPEETWNVSATAVTTTTAVDYLTAQNWYYTTASTAGACTLNIRGNSTTTLASLLSTGQSVTFSFAITTGASTPAYFNAIQIDGTASGVTTRWQYGNTPTSGTTSGVDMYSLTVVKTAVTPTYTVFASVCKW